MTAPAADIPAGRPLAAVATLCRNVAVLLLALMSVLVIVQIVGRNVFATGTPWADELARFCGVSLVFLCIPVLALRGQHVAVDMVPMMLPPAGRRAFAIVGELMVLSFACIMVWALYAFLGRAWKFATPTLGIPNWVLYAPAAIAFGLLALVTVARLASLMRRAPAGREEKPS